MEIRTCTDRRLHCQGLGLSQDIEAAQPAWVHGVKVAASYDRPEKKSLIHHGLHLLCLLPVCVQTVSLPQAAPKHVMTGILKGVKTIIRCKFVFAHILLLRSFRHVYFSHVSDMIWHILNLKLWQGFLHIWVSFWSCDYTLRAGFDLTCSSFGGLNFPFLLPLQAFQNLS